MQERDAVRDKLHAIHEREYRKLLKAHPTQFFRPGEQVWVRNWVVSELFTPSSTGCVEGLLRSLHDSSSRHIG